MSAVPQQQLVLRVTDTIAQQIRSSISKSIDDQPALLVEIEPEQEGEGKEDCFIFTFNQAKYPALLLNLPTVIEAQKTFDRKIFYKSGDIGQMLQVFDSEKAREMVKTKKTKIRHGETYYINGLTPPTQNIIKNRYELAYKSSDIYPPHKVKSVVNDISSPWNIREESATNTGNRTSIPTAASTVAPPIDGSKSGGEYIEITTEEIVEFEEWMVAADETNTSGKLMGLKYKVETNEWNTGQLGNIIMEHPEILESPKEENVYIVR